MPANERSVSDVLQDIIRNIQEIVRSEVHLAKTEIQDEAAQSKTAVLVTAAGALTGIFAALFLLLAILYALSLVIASWAAALIVGGMLAIVAAITLNAGLKRFKQLSPLPNTGWKP